MENIIRDEVFGRWGFGDGAFPGARRFQEALAAIVGARVSRLIGRPATIWLMETHHNPRPCAVVLGDERHELDGLFDMPAEQLGEVQAAVRAAYQELALIVREYIRLAHDLERFLESCEEVASSQAAFAWEAEDEEA